MSPAPSCGLFHSLKFSAALPPSTSRWTSHETGAMFEYQGHLVRFEWQSKHALAASARVCGESHRGSAVTGGFVCDRP